MLPKQLPFGPQKISINPRLYRKSDNYYQRRIATEQIPNNKSEADQSLQQTKNDPRSRKISHQEKASHDNQRLSFQSFLKEKKKINLSVEWLGIGKPRQFYVSYFTKKNSVQMSKSTLHGDPQCQSCHVKRAKTQESNFRKTQRSRQKERHMTVRQNLAKCNSQLKKKRDEMRKTNESMRNCNIKPEYRPWSRFDKDDFIDSFYESKP